MQQVNLFIECILNTVCNNSSQDTFPTTYQTLYNTTSTYRPGDLRYEMIMQPDHPDYEKLLRVLTPATEALKSYSSLTSERYRINGSLFTQNAQALMKHDIFPLGSLSENGDLKLFDGNRTTFVRADLLAIKGQNWLLRLNKDNLWPFFGSNGGPVELMRISNSYRCAEAMSKIHADGIEICVKYLFPIPNVSPFEIDISKRYFFISKKFSFINYNEYKLLLETNAEIQRLVAEKVAILIIETGYRAENAHPNNIQLLEDLKTVGCVDFEAGNFTPKRSKAEALIELKALVEPNYDGKNIFRHQAVMRDVFQQHIDRLEKEIEEEAPTEVKQISLISRSCEVVSAVSKDVYYVALRGFVWQFQHAVDQFRVNLSDTVLESIKETITD